MRILLEKAGVQGYLTTDDLMEVFPDASQDMERLSVLLTTLRRQGYDILDRMISLASRIACEPFDQSIESQIPLSRSQAPG